MQPPQWPVMVRQLGIEEHLLGGEVELVAVEGVAREVLLRLVARGGTQHVEPVVGVEIGIGGDADQAILDIVVAILHGVDRHRAGQMVGPPFALTSLTAPNFSITTMRPSGSRVNCMQSARSRDSTVFSKRVSEGLALL
jgi:hypothetical protein